MVGIIEKNDTTVHRRHLSQIHFKEPSTPCVYLNDSQAENENPGDLLTDKAVADSTTMPPLAVAIRKSFRQAIQVDWEFSREEGCCELARK